MNAATKSMEMNDLALVRRAQSGEAGPFDRLVRKYWQSVVQIAMRYVRNRDDAEDAAQETFLRAFCGLGRFRGESAFYTWLYRIAMNSAMTLLAARARHRVVFPVRIADVARAGARGPELVDLDSPENCALSRELCCALDEAIDELPKWQRIALMLHEQRGLTYLEVAVAMGCPVGTVRSRISRAHAAIDLRLTKWRHVWDASNHITHCPLR
jgi:RNA polymerase sigma-70 factor, ECF subfamily